PRLAALFPETGPAGRVESPLLPVDRLATALGRPPGAVLVKADNLLPIAGSVKARGGVYEVLHHAETRGGGRVTVGSTGNLGFAVGVMARALGLSAEVHLSAEARDWKKRRLREVGALVVEHAGDYGAAVAGARAAAEGDPLAHFVDDEGSEQLFLGYAAAAFELAAQLTALGRVVDAERPLFVHLPCGVGGAPSGIAWGLAHLFGDHAHCFAAEPVASPCLLAALIEGRPVAVSDLGLDNVTEADGLAVARASPLALEMAGDLLAGAFTVEDDDLFRWLALLHRHEGLAIEPSAAAGFPGAFEHPAPAGATHVVWLTGGGKLPQAVWRGYLERRPKP
ncbi:MAG: D-serine ammonia-lyase, partial [Alphaproteobacteria bacterium]|nr:D-serine ammonia-lyase [Alphaproteobacteria bacterium]